jgi:hypothetical protein
MAGGRAAVVDAPSSPSSGRVLSRRHQCGHAGGMPAAVALRKSQDGLGRWIEERCGAEHDAAVV